MPLKDRIKEKKGKIDQCFVAQKVGIVTQKNGANAQKVCSIAQKN